MSLGLSPGPGTFVRRRSHFSCTARKAAGPQAPPKRGPAAIARTEAGAGACKLLTRAEPPNWPYR